MASVCRSTFFFQAEDGIRYLTVTGVQTCALPIFYILSRILHDVVKGLLAGRGFVGHIGGDDFIFIIPFDDIPDVCGEVLEVFDTLIPYQYNEQDRRGGGYFRKERRGPAARRPPPQLPVR